MTPRYAKNAGAVFSLKFHLVWCPKYRRPVLVDIVAQRLEALLQEKAAELELTVHALEIMPDHVHLFVEADPRWSVAEVTTPPAKAGGFLCDARPTGPRFRINAVSPHFDA